MRMEPHTDFRISTALLSDRQEGPPRTSSQSWIDLETASQLIVVWQIERGLRRSQMRQLSEYSPALHTRTPASLGSLYPRHQRETPLPLVLRECVSGTISTTQGTDSSGSKYPKPPATIRPCMPQTRSRDSRIHGTTGLFRALGQGGAIDWKA